MSVIKISELTEKTTLAGTEDLLINDSGTSKKMKTSLIKNIQTACETAQTAAELAETNAETAESNAAASASAASTSASNAASSASAASTSASSASSSASSASTSASAASSAQSAAESARDATLAAYDSFDDRYLGVKASAPSLDNDGNALVAGALYFDSTSQKMQIYNGTSWVDAYTTGSSLVAKAGDTMTGNLNFGDNVKAVFGAGSDLQIYHDGTHSYVQDAGTGNLVLKSSDTVIQSNTAETMAVFNGNGSVDLYYDSSKKLATTSTGIDVTGTVTADGLAVDTNVLYVDSTANTVGIGTSTPTSGVSSSQRALEISHGNVAALALTNTAATTGKKYTLYSDTTGGLVVYDTTAGGFRSKIASNGDISFYEDTGTTAKFFWDASAESLGIGMSSPLAALDVTGTDAVGTITSLADTVTRAATIIRGSTHANGYGLYIGYGNSSTDAQYIQSTLKTGSQAYPLLLNPYGGNVGIGTSSPSANLHISGGPNQTLKVENTAESTFTVTAGGSVTLGSTSNMVFASGGTTERMRIDSSGNLLVGKTTIATGTAGIALRSNGEVRGTANGDYAARFSRLSSDGAIVGFEKDGAAVGSIGNSGSNLKVTSAGELRFFTSTSNEDMRLETDGDLHVDGNVIAYSTTISDERLKENIEVVTDATSKLKQIRGVTFTRKDSGEQSAGVIAQEIEKILPQAVKEKALPLHTGTEDLYKTVEYDALHTVLIEAVKELTARVEQLEKNNG